MKIWSDLKLQKTCNSSYIPWVVVETTMSDEVERKLVGYQNPLVFTFCQITGWVFQTWYVCGKGWANIWLNWQFSRKKMFFYKQATSTHRNAWLHSNSSQYAIIFPHTAQKMEFSIKDFLSKCDQIRRKLPIWSNLLKKLLMENFIFSAVPIISQCRLFF